MADNLAVKDASGFTVILRTTDLGTSTVPHHYVDGQVMTVVNASGTIGSGTTSQQLLAASSTRLGGMLQNQHATEALWVNPLGVAAVIGQPSLMVAAGATICCPKDFPLTTTQVNVNATTTGHPFAAFSW